MASPNYMSVNNDDPHLYPDSPASPSPPLMGEGKYPLQLEEQVSNHSIRQENDAPQPRNKKSAFQRLASFSWWWEIGAIVFSSVCVVVIAVILFVLDGSRQEDWHASIQPNSLISIFSTVSRAALLFALAECIGQLKWAYFEEECRPLHDIETFESASRGPWGSAIFLFTIPRRKATITTMLAILGALITIILLAFDPFTQQVIKFVPRTAVLRNNPGSMFMATSWNDRGGMDMNFPAVYPLVTGLMGVVAQPDNLTSSGLANANCPTERCEFPDVTSLAVCSKCESESIQINDFNCSVLLSFPNTQNSSANTTNLDSYSEFKDNFLEYLDQGLDLVGLHCSYAFDDNTFPPFQINATIQLTNLTAEDDKVLSPRLHNALLSHEPGTDERNQRLYDKRNETGIIDDPFGPMRFCESYMDQYAASVYRDNRPEVSPTYLFSFSCFESTTDLMLWDQIAHLGQINGTVSRCGLDYCAQTYKDPYLTKNGQSRVAAREIIDRPLRQLNDTEAQIAGWKKSNATYALQKPEDGISGEFFLSKDVRQMLYGVWQTVTDSANFEWYYYQSYYLAKKDNTVAGLFKDLADTFSTVIQGYLNPQAEQVSGDALGAVVFIEVRWRWFAMPLVTVALAILFIVLTMVRSRNSGFLFKKYTLPTIFHGLDGFDTSAYNQSKKPHYDGILKMARAMTVKLESNAEGKLKLKKAI